ncbi:MAG: retroviral-like aspartic protease family protein [Candidatus Bathycorpusculaceae bacterium]
MLVVGYVRVRGTVANPSERSLKMELDFIVDTGAIYTVITKRVADKLRLKETGRRKFKMANGDIVEYPISEAYIIIDGEGVTSVVAIADEKTPVLLGVTTLELLGLKVDPVTGKLTPLELMIL